jgi:hypothetical protein
MSIEFKCLMCNERLTFPDDLAGQKEKCPQCGVVVTIPAPIGGRLTAKRLPVTGSVVATQEQKPRLAVPSATIASPIKSSAPRRGRIVGSDRVAAAVAGLKGIFAEWVQAGRRPHSPRVRWWIFAIVGFLLPASLVVIVLVASAFQNGIRPPNIILFVLFVVGLPLVGGIGGFVVGWMVDARALASYQSLEAAAHSLGLSYVGQRTVPVRKAPWYAVLPLLHFEPDAGEESLATTVVVAGRIDNTDVFVVHLRQFVNMVRESDSPIINAVQSMNRRNTLQARWLTAILVCGESVETPDLLVLPKDDIERHYNEGELPALQHVHTHPLTAHWVASSHHDWAQQACRALPPRVQHDPQLALQLLSGNLALWRGHWKLLGPDEKTSGDWIADVRLAIELRRVLLERQGESTSR